MSRVVRACALVLVLVACGGGSTTTKAPAATKEAKETTAPTNTAAPCSASLRVLRSLRAPLRIEAYVTRGTPSLDTFARDVEQLLERHRNASGGKVTIEIVDAKEATGAARATNAGLEAYDLGEDRHGYMGLVITYGTERHPMKSLPTERPGGLELAVLSSMRTLVDRVDGTKHSIGVLTGHGERRIDTFDLVSTPIAGEQASLASIITKFFPSYRFTDVDVANGEREIDPSIDALLVLQPTSDLSEKELRALDAFVMRGKGLLVAASAVNVSRNSGSPLAHVGAHHLDRLLAGYGIVLHEDVVLEFATSFTILVSTPNGPRTMRFPQFPRAANDTLDERFPPFLRIPEITLPYASSVDVRPEIQPKAKVHVVARTSPSATAATGPDVDVSITQRWKVPSKVDQLSLAAASEGTLKSAFGNATSARRASVLLLASASPFANPFVVRDETVTDLDEQLAPPYAQKTLTNAILAFKNTLDWMTSEDDLGECVR